ncbi:MAG: hypothetical protein JWO67_70 [Streptosporangiaceae bacterium]|nr:hypothetical protein [Streptosporangiaceae bacterium]
MPDLTDTQLDQLIARLGLAEPKHPGRPLAPCGTESAYNRHVRKGEPIDDACRRANTKAKAEQQRQPVQDSSRLKPIAHGEPRGAKQHRYRGEELCDACHRAEAEYQRERASGAPRKARTPKPKQYLTEEEWQARRAARQSGGAQ